MVERRANHHEVEMLVAVQVRDRDVLRRAGLVPHRDQEAPLGVVEDDGDARAVVHVGHGKVRPSVGVEVAGGDVPRTAAGARCIDIHGRLECNLTTRNGWAGRPEGWLTEAKLAQTIDDAGPADRHDDDHDSRGGHSGEPQQRSARREPTLGPKLTPCRCGCHCRIEHLVRDRTCAVFQPVLEPALDVAVRAHDARRSGVRASASSAARSAGSRDGGESGPYPRGCQAPPRSRGWRGRSSASARAPLGGRGPALGTHAPVAPDRRRRRRGPGRRCGPRSSAPTWLARAGDAWPPRRRRG